TARGGRSAGTLGFVLTGKNVVDGLLNGGDLLGFLVRDLRLELFFERHHELYGIQGIRPKVVHERGVVLDLVGFEPELLGDDRSDLLFDTAHLRGTPHELTSRTQGPGRRGAYCIEITGAILPRWRAPKTPVRRPPSCGSGLRAATAAVLSAIV